MKFSVIIPVYNGEKFISRAIESVLSQTCEDWELIVINDGSTDNTFDIVNTYSKTDSRIKPINRSENSGRPAVARNLGLREAKGQYVAFLDSDDIYYPEKLSEVIKVFEADESVGLVCHGEKHLVDGKVKKVDFYGPYEKYEDLLFRGNSLSTSAVVFRKDCLQKAGNFSERLEFRGVEDYDFWMKLSRFCKISYLRKVLGEYHIRKGSVSSDIANHCANTMSLLDEHFLGLDKARPYYRNAIQRRKSLCLRAAAKDFLKINDLKNAKAYISAAISAYPLAWKNWALVVIIRAKESFLKSGSGAHI